MEKFVFLITLDSVPDVIPSLFLNEFPYIEREKTFSGRLKYFDTFDCKLIKNGIRFYKSGGVYKLEFSDNRSPISFKQKTLPTMLNTLPESISEVLKPLVGIRSLLPAVEIYFNETPLLFLNDDRKIVVRGKLKEFSISDPNEVNSKLYRLIELLPLRGYGEAGKTAENILLKNLPGRRIKNNELLKVFFSSSRYVSLNYTSKPVFNLQPQMNAFETVILILKGLLSVIKANENGIIGDFDTEFLHDYRVAIRKTRSVAGQLKKVFNTEQLKGHTDNLKKIAAATNNLRDMDVYLLSEKEYQKMLPPNLHEELIVFFEDVKKKRKKEKKLVTDMLLSEDYQKRMDSWSSFLYSNKTVLKGDEADSRIINVAKKYIYKRYQKIIKRGCNISNTSNDEEFHQIRINCKKLRYLLELFSSLFPENEISSAIKQLKKMQDTLGNFNDMCMQQEHLNEYLYSIPGQNSDNTRISAAIGGLITSAYNKKNDCRIEFYERFNEFISNNNKMLYEQLFKH
ncbi:MAG: CHAD domain-containing protein [Victivallales bacterium]|nr:CHAD domain-containing protein [Victivallales bacterium]